MKVKMTEQPGWFSQNVTGPIGSFLSRAADEAKRVAGLGQSPLVNGQQLGAALHVPQEAAGRTVTGGRRHKTRRHRAKKHRKTGKRKH